MEYLYKKMRTSNFSNINESKLKQDAQDWRYKQDVLVTLICRVSQSSGKRKTCINISIRNVFRRDDNNTSDLWPPQLQDILNVVAIGFQTFMRAAKYCLSNICNLNTC